MPTLFQISIGVNSGSVGRIAEQIGLTVMAQGWNSYITYARNCVSSRSKTIKIGNKFDIYWHGINTRLFDNHCLCSTSATKKLVAQINRIKPDIIQIHNIHGYYINMKVLFNFLGNFDIPVVWTLHDCWSFTGHCAHFDYIGCEKWITGCYKCPQKGVYPSSKLLDRSSRNYKLKNKYFNNVKNMTIIPVSNWLGELVEKSYLKKYPVHVIHNGVDIDIFKPILDNDDIYQKYNLYDKFILLGVASKWTKQKGFEDFMLLNDIIDHEKYKIILVGLSSRQVKQCPEEIIGIGRTENINELVALYSASGVFLNLTWEDTFPTTNLESLACGTPVITYQTGGSVESVFENVGIIVKKGNIADIYKAITKIIEKEKAYYVDNCRKVAVTYFNRWERYKEYLDLYNRLLK